ncbi:hypothetical protein IWX64_003431 [Arthrobacter sp. CAN_A212]
MDLFLAAVTHDGTNWFVVIPILILVLAVGGTLAIKNLRRK